MKQLVAGLTLLGISLLPAGGRAGDGYLKGGFIVHPDELSLDDRWLASFGGEWGVSRTLYLGGEIQSAYRGYTTGGKIRLRVVPINIFVNGKFKSESPDVRAYGGGGIGMISALAWETVLLFPSVVRDSGYAAEPAFHFMGGVELKRKFVLELMVQRTFKDVEAFSSSVERPLSISPWTRFHWMILAGLAW